MFRTLAALSAVSAAFALSAPALGQSFFDDFADGNDTGWYRSHFGEQYNYRFTVVSGAYRHSSLDLCPADGSSGALSVWNDSIVNPSAYHDGVLSAKVRILAAGVSASLFLRSDTNLYCYSFVLSSARNAMVIEAIAPGETSITVLDLVEIPGGVQLGTAYQVAASAVGRSISMKVWRDGDPEPAEPQIRVRDNRLPSGILGLASYVSAYAAAPARIDVRYDNVSFSTVTPCEPDYNADGNLDPDDLGDYITCFFSDPPCDDADFNADGNTDPDDLGDFITSYFQGCV